MSYGSASPVTPVYRTGSEGIRDKGGRYSMLVMQGATIEGVEKYWEAVSSEDTVHVDGKRVSDEEKERGCK